MPEPPPKSEPVRWDCPNGHEIGMRVGDHLLIYHEARHGDIVIAEVIGNAILYCSICGAARRWKYRKRKPCRAELCKPHPT